MKLDKKILESLGFKQDDTNEYHLTVENPYDKYEKTFVLMIHPANLSRGYHKTEWYFDGHRVNTLEELINTIILLSIDFGKIQLQQEIRKIKQKMKSLLEY